MMKLCPLCKKLHRSDDSLNNLFNDAFVLCYNCFSTFKVIFKRFKIDDCMGLAIYDYQSIKDHLFRLKGLYDISVAPIFLERFIFYLNILYEGYLIVRVPSSLQDDLKRGFNHVDKIFENLKSKRKNFFYKNRHYKQSDQPYENRHLIKDVIKVDKGIKTQGKILLIDDVLTTGQTMKTCLNLAKKLGAKKIKILVLSMVCR